MRLAITSTPRSGNTWLRYMLSSLYGLEEYAIHQANELDWETLPENCVVQLHWHPSAELTNLLNTHQFRVLSLARHPLDVLISILHFAPFAPQTACWLAGEGGGEESLYGRSPTSAEFYAYATGPRAKALLAVTPEWWTVPTVERVRYENLVYEPTKSWEILFQRLGPPVGKLSDTLRQFTLEKLQPSAQNRHFWKGSPGLWRVLLPAETACRLADVHAGVFSALNYNFRPNAPLSVPAAEKAWLKLQDEDR